MALAKRIVLILFLLFSIAVAVGLLIAFRILVVTETSIDPKKSVVPDILTTASGTPITTIDAWEAERATVLDTIQSLQYGSVPTTELSWQVEKTTLNTVFDGKATYEHWQLSVPDTTVELNIVLLLPANDSPVPLLVGSNFCPHHVRFTYDLPTPEHYPSFCDVENNVLISVRNRFFGEYIDTFPFERFAEENIAFASVYLGELAADDPVAALDDLEMLRAATGSTVDGVLAAWAYGFIESVRILEQDDRIDATRTGVYGHSRDGKAALLAGAVSERIDLVLSHQSGKGGGSLWQREVGESIESVTDNFPHWFTPGFADYVQKETELPFDQHQLIAMLAPRPVLFSMAWMDKWSDPAGTVHAAHEATKIYDLYGADGITSTSLADFTPSHELAFFIRPETHGVRAVDWDAFFAFIEAHF